MTSLCARLSKGDSQPLLITNDNQFELKLSTYTRQPGTVVDVSCYANHNLIGPNRLTCRSDAKWDAIIPICSDRFKVQDAVNGGLTETEYIAIGATSGIGLLVIVAFIFVFWFMMRKIKNANVKNKMPEPYATETEEQETSVGRGKVEDDKILSNNTGFERTDSLHASRNQLDYKSLPNMFALNQWVSFPTIPRPDYDRQPHEQYLTDNHDYHDYRKDSTSIRPNVRKENVFRKNPALASPHSNTRWNESDLIRYETDHTELYSRQYLQHPTSPRVVDGVVEEKRYASDASMGLYRPLAL